MRVRRIVDIAFWTDRKVDTNFSPEDKYFMLYLLTNPYTTLLGIYEISIKQAAYQMGYSVDTFNTLLERFENEYQMIRYSKETGEVAIKNFLRHSIISGGKPVEDCLKRDIENVKDKSLIEYVFNSIANKNDLNETVKKVIQDYKNNKNIATNNMDMGMDESYHDSYDDSYHDSYDDSYHDSSSPLKKPVKHRYGEYKNVLLTDDEYSKLCTEFPDIAERIERLSSYIASKGTAYKSHYATIRNWARKDKEQAETPYVNPKAKELEEFYKMSQEWANEHE